MGAYAPRSIVYYCTMLIWSHTPHKAYIFEKKLNSRFNMGICFLSTCSVMQECHKTSESHPLLLKSKALGRDKEEGGHTTNSPPILIHPCAVGLQPLIWFFALHFHLFWLFWLRDYLIVCVGLFCVRDHWRCCGLNTWWSQVAWEGCFQWLEVSDTGDVSCQ